MTAADSADSLAPYHIPDEAIATTGVDITTKGMAHA